MLLGFEVLGALRERLALWLDLRYVRQARKVVLPYGPVAAVDLIYQYT